MMAGQTANGAFPLHISAACFTAVNRFREGVFFGETHGGIAMRGRKTSGAYWRPKVLNGSVGVLRDEWCSIFLDYKISQFVT